LLEVLYRIEYSPDAEGHLRWLTARQRTVVLDAVDEQLTHEPMVETRNRKPMRPNPLAPWELRIAELRVYYDIEQEPEHVIYVRAVGVKQGNRVRIADEVIEL
jgi:mRNA-degrading endonuclease RelE of RelBE toxin-antitoxin system